VTSSQLRRDRFAVKDDIYICAARHVGLALAKSSISMGKCVAFAFGCESVDDIRLHYNSAVEFTKNKKSGSIAKVATFL
jgi:hypothetical protein